MSEPDFSLASRRAAKARLVSGDGGGDDGGMLERRVAALEADMREVRGSLGRIEKVLERLDERMRKLELEVAEVKGRVSQLPNTWQMLLGGLTMIGFVFALVRFGLR